LRDDRWTALGDPTRPAIFERLAERPHAVTELARELSVSRPALSQHLKVLRRGAVVDRQAGKQLRLVSAGPARAPVHRRTPMDLWYNYSSS
jgi:DNA-binding transcriptional ArsR family regulator